jgi:hypothetical protein
MSYIIKIVHTSRYKDQHMSSTFLGVATEIETGKVFALQFFGEGCYIRNVIKSYM